MSEVVAPIAQLMFKSSGLEILKRSIKSLRTKNPISVSHKMLAAKALAIMNEKKITSLCVYGNSPKITIGIIHIHHLLKANIE